MVVATDRPEAVEARDAQPGRRVGVRRATGRGVGDLEAKRSRYALGVLDEPAAAFELLHRPPARHRLEVDGHVGDLDRLGDLADRGFGRLERLASGGPD